MIYCDDTKKYGASEVFINGLPQGRFSAPVEVELIVDKCFYLTSFHIRRASEGCNAFCVYYLHNPIDPAPLYQRLGRLNSEAFIPIDTFVNNTLGGYAALPSTWLFNDGQSVAATISAGGGVPSHAFCRTNGVVTNNSSGYINNTLYWHCAIASASLKVSRTAIKINGTLLPQTYYNPIVNVECIPRCPDGETWDEECQECICTVICDGTIASIIRSIVL